MESAPHKAEGSTLGCVGSAVRVLIGPGLLLAMGGGLAANEASFGSLWDFLFLAALLLTIAAGLLAPAPSAAERAPGDVAPMSRGKYLGIVIALAAAIYVFAHVLAPRIF